MDNIIYRKNLNIGSISAESDSEFLENCFIETTEYKEIIDFNNKKMILLGRTGIGKTALLNKVKKNVDVYIEVRPDTFVLQYITNVPFVSKLKEQGVNLDIFYKFLWLHEIISQIIKKYFAYNKKDFIQELKNKVKDKGRIAELSKYLSEYENIFFDEGSTEKITKDFENSIVAVLGNNMGGKVEGKLQESTKKEIQARASQYINKKQISQLKNIITLFKDYFNINKQRKIIVGIDNLDENWIDEDTKYKLIDALLNAIKLFIDIPNLKILLAMRADLFAKTCEETKRQNEKDVSYTLKINWTKEELINLINKRLQYMFEFKYKKNSKVLITDIFNFDINKIPASDYIVSRTMLRPRDIIEFINFCIEEADGQTNISAQNVLSAEKHFRRTRLDALKHEWNNIYGDVNPYIEIINKLGNNFKYKELDIEKTYATLENIVYNHMKNCNLFEKYMENNSDLYGKEQSVKETINIMYIMGLIGIKDENEIQYSTPNNPTLNPYDYYSNNLEFVVHPLFQI